MDVSTVTVLGNVTAEPRITVGEESQVDRASFRVVATQRRLDRETNTWADAGEYGVNVVCWRSLARGVAGSIHTGDPVLVVGRITERHYEVDGQTRYTTEVTASYVGHDLSKGRSQFKRFGRGTGGAGGAVTDSAEDTAAEGVSGVGGVRADGGDTGGTGPADGTDRRGAVTETEVPVPFEVDEGPRRLAAV